MDRHLRFSVAHDLSPADAKARVDQGLVRVTRPDGPLGAVGVTGNHHWDGNHASVSLHALGQHVTADVHVHPGRVEVDVLLPWLLAQVAERLRPQIEEQTRKALELPAT